jgi:WD40 repeat protein
MADTPGRNTDAAAFEATETNTPPPIAIVARPDAPTLPVVPPETYRFQGEHARGGIGRVLRAEDLRLRRPVAVKELIGNDEQARRRFLREAELTARLQHPSIVPIYEAGIWPDGRPFYAMKFISGRSLKELIASTESLDARLALLPHVMAVAEAITYAHSHRIVHRDLKPTNIVIGEFGETMVVDWGLGKDLSTFQDGEPAGAQSSPDPVHTLEGTVIGTPAFMSPEQAAGRPVDERTDVYAIGAILYNLLSGRPPYAGSSAKDVLAAVVAHSAPPVTRPEPGVPRDLAAIVDKAMSADPANRYPHAGALTEDLRRFQTGQLVRAHEYSSWALARRWMWRRRALLAVGGLALFAVLITLGLSFRRINRARAVAESERAQAVAKRNQLTLLQARSLLATEPTRSLAWLKTYPTDAAGWDEAQAIAAEAESAHVARHLLPTGTLITAAFSPDSSRLVTSGTAGRVDLWAVDAGTSVASLPLEADVNRVVFAPDGKSVAIGTADGTVLRWRFQGKADTVAQHQAIIGHLSYSPEGRWLASGDAVGTVRITPLDGGTARVLHLPGWINALSFSPDGKTVAYANGGGELTVYTLEDGRTRSLVGHHGQVFDLDFSDDSAWLASTGEDGTVRVWSTTSGIGRVVGTHPGGAGPVRFVANSNTLVSYGADRKISSWDAVHATSIGSFAGPSERPQVVVTSKNGAVVASGDMGGNVFVWNRLDGEPERLLLDGQGIMAMQLSPTGAWLVTGGNAKVSQLWHLARRDRRRFPDPTGDIPTHASFAPDGRSFATSAGTAVRVCDVAKRSCRVLRGRDPAPTHIAWSPDGTRVITAGYAGARLWDVASGDATVLQQPSPVVNQARFAPDGRVIAIGGNDGVIRIFTPDGRPSRSLSGHVGPVLDVRYTRDGRSLVSGGDDQTVRVWDLATGTGRVLKGPKQRVHVVASSPDGRRIAGACWDGTLWTWDLSSGTGRPLVAATDVIPALAFVGNDRLLAASWEGAIFDWNLNDGTHAILRGHQGRVRDLVVFPDGRRIATGGEDHTIRVWDLQTRGVSVWRGHVATVRTLDVSGDGRWLLSASDDRTAGVWHVDDAALVPAGSGELRRWLDGATSSTIEEARPSAGAP